MSPKKTVTFTNLVRWESHPSGAAQAVLAGVRDHYRLGNVDFVRTSAVVRIEYQINAGAEAVLTREPVLIETLNTIYRRDAG